jgi:hypothetical protein
MLKRFIPGALLLMLILAAAPSAADSHPDVKLIAHPDVPDVACSEKNAQRIFLGKKTRWEGGLRVVPVMLRDGDVHEIFVEDLLDRSVAKFEIYWKQAVFTGKGIPPRSFDSELALMAYVADTPGAVGYVAKSTSLRGVKELVCQ